MNEPKWINSAIATAIHDEAICEFGGLAAIRDAGLLESALDRPRNLLADELQTSIFRLAATLSVGIARTVLLMMETSAPHFWRRERFYI